MPSDRADIDARQSIADREKEMIALAGGLAHEIKNPLSTIQLNMELLAEDLADPHTPRERNARKRVDIVEQECRRLAALLDSFLDFAKVQPTSLKPTDLNAEIDSILDFFSPEATSSGIEIIRFLDPDLPHLALDREQFRGAFLNLILNATQAMPEGGELLVRTVPKGDAVAIHLIDTGCGMDERTASKMFDTFYSTKPNGSGFGLPTTQKIIAAHGGRITVQSEIGHGTEFVIELPVPQRIPSNDGKAT